MKVHRECNHDSATQEIHDVIFEALGDSDDAHDAGIKARLNEHGLLLVVGDRRFEIELWEVL